jgi:hypothetical protein
MSTTEPTGASSRSRKRYCEQRATLLVDKTHPKVKALYETCGWQQFGDLRPRIPDAPTFDAMILPLRTM